MGKFIKLMRANVWGSEFYKLPGGSSLTYEGRLHLVEGGVVEIRWPDGTQNRVTIRHHRVYTKCPDQGGPRDVEYALAGFDADVHGVSRWFALDEVEVNAGDIAAVTRLPDTPKSEFDVLFEQAWSFRHGR